MTERIETETDAVQFMKRVKFALRYNSTPSLPLASMYTAAHDKRRAIELTNALLASSEAVETNVIADRLVLVHRDVVPALYALRSSKEGFPYRVFERAHPALVKTAKKMNVDDAIEIIREAAGSIPPKKFASMFKLIL